MKRVVCVSHIYNGCQLLYLFPFLFFLFPDPSATLEITEGILDCFADRLEPMILSS
jgi:hypothetical protein